MSTTKCITAADLGTALGMEVGFMGPYAIYHVQPPEKPVALAPDAVDDGQMSRQD